MSQQKKSLYDLYPKLLDQLHNRVKRGLPGKEGKSLTRKDAIQMVDQFTPGFVHSLDFMIMSEELCHEEHGSHAIFPESAAVLDNLLRAKYQMDSPDGFTLPYDSFIMAIPHGYAFDGVKIESFMVTFLPYRKSQDYTTTPFCRKMGLLAPESYVHEDSRPEAMSIALSYRDPVTKGYIRTLQIDHSLPHILKCKTAQEFKAAIGEYESKIEVLDLSEDELMAQFLSVKLVAALGVYHLATNGSRLVDGFPGKVMPRVNNLDKGQKVRFSTLCNKADPGEAASKEAFYRTWFFRQLRDERYYRGEHENTPRGSRYSFVSDTVVGQKVDAHTQKIG